MERKKILGVAGVIAALFGLLVLPLLVQQFYGVEAFKTAFIVIVSYAALNWYMKSS